MIEQIVVPSLGMSFEYVTLTKWTKNEGEYVKKDETIAEATSDKITMDITSTMDGYLIKQLYSVHDVVPVKANVAIVATEKDEEIPEDLVVNGKKEINDSTESKTEEINSYKNDEKTSSPKKKASPVAKKIIKEKNLNIQEIVGTGLKGMITREDVEKFIDSQNQNEISSKKDLNTGDDEIIETIPYVGIRKVIGDNLTKSVNTIVHVTTGLEVDMTESMTLRKKLLANEEIENISLLTFVTRAIVNAIKNHPIVNSTLVDDVIIIKRNINMGIAVATPNGLIVPVIKNMQNLNFIETATSIEKLTTKGRDNKIEANDLQGGTITLSNAGTFGATTSTPIINYPQSSILWMGKIEKKPAVVDGEVVIRSMVNLLCSYDHRVVDGSTIGMFLTEIKNSLESPEILLI